MYIANKFWTETMLTKPSTYLLFLFLIFGCSSSTHEEKYIQMLEDKIEELTELSSELESKAFIQEDVINKVYELYEFTCFDELHMDQVSVYRNSKKSWLVSIEKSTDQFDEFGFPLIRKITFEVIESEGFLVPILDMDTGLCD